MAATIRDVAEAAGVSTATVSRALHSDARVTARTRLKVVEAAERLAYRPSAAASRLATGRHGAVAVVAVGGLSAQGAELLSGICAVLAEEGVDCALELCADGAATGVLRGLMGRVDAAVVVGARSSDDGEAGLPVVVIDDVRLEPHRTEAAALAAGHLHAMGYAQVAILGEGTVDAAAAVDALSGRDGLAMLLPPTLVERHGVEAAARAAAALLVGARRPDAIVCTSDRLVRGAHRALLRHNLVPGPDVGLVGLGSEQVLEDLDVTMVMEPLRQLGEEAARAALRLISALPDGTRVASVRPQLAVGSSTLRLRREPAT